MKSLNYKGLTGEVVTEDNVSYEESRIQWNRAIEKYPLVIIYCYNNEDIKNAIAWAKLNEIAIRVRSGGHHYEGYSTGDGIAVIDVSRMNTIEIDEEENLVKVQGGVRNRELYEALGQKNYPFPGGGCPTVGVVGFTLGGGWGYSCRALGLGCDSLVEVEMIDYNGELIVANEKCHEDLFWACRGGGGGNFGIVTSMTFKLQKKIEMGTLIIIEYPNRSPEAMRGIFETYQEVFKDLDNRFTFKMAIYNSEEKGKGVKLTGMFYGSEEEAHDLLAPFKAISGPINFDTTYTSVLEINRIIQDSHPDYEKYKSSGRFVYKDYTKDEMEELIHIVNERPEGSYYVALTLYGLGGKVREIDKQKMAFYYRDAKFIMGLQSVWEDMNYAPRNREWVKTAMKPIKRLTVGAFINFPQGELADYEAEYYGENVEKLKNVKEKYDPYNVFNFPQVIRTNTK